MLTPAFKRSMQYTKAYLMPGPGGNGSTDIRDETGRAITLRNIPYIATDVAKICKVIVFNNLSEQDIVYGASDDWMFPGDFTVQCFARQVSNADQILFMHDSTSGVKWGIEIVSSIRAFACLGGSVLDVSGLSISAGQWYHWCIERSGTTTRFYKDGYVVGSGSDAGVVGNNTGALYVGSFAGSLKWNGYIEMFKVDKGRALYNGAFTPPTRRF